ncbi:hypothetical protein C4D60_Mb03t21920 [Musa balbisiana]|uniref:Uncharacterized protein n=1 Tax=Musa balbisiana TaxID=52838 RepID=A0A4V4H6A3_MUSBA|nr:hypothetical protein C4D60_Mb03t21920 [Musa balbisiana]
MVFGRRGRRKLAWHSRKFHLPLENSDDVATVRPQLRNPLQAQESQVDAKARLFLVICILQPLIHELQEIAGLKQPPAPAHQARLLWLRRRRQHVQRPPPGDDDKDQNPEAVYIGLLHRLITAMALWSHVAHRASHARRAAQLPTEQITAEHVAAH